MKTPVPERFFSEAYTSIISSTASTDALTIATRALATMQQAAIHGYPHEICGLLIGTLGGTHWQITEARQVANLNRERASDRFHLDPAAYQQIDRELRGTTHEIIGVFHSHPDCPAMPSPTDIGHAWEGFLYPIISVYASEIAEISWWRLSENSKQFQLVTDNIS
ncbi:MAG: M67 family metallopeptidase [Mariprofundales bacterium]|nr:M67 family metallopeptidase [Mariprofundales bacterium]